MRPVSPLLHFFVYTFCSLQTAVLHCRSPSFASSFHRPFTALSPPFALLELMNASTFCRRPHSIHVEPPTKERGGVLGMTVLAGFLRSVAGDDECIDALGLGLKRSHLPTSTLMDASLCS